MFSNVKSLSDSLNTPKLNNKTHDIHTQKNTKDITEG